MSTGPVAEPVLGFYGPHSVMWRINREAVLLGAGPAALLLQVAHPLIALGVARHSDFRTDPFGRLRRTLATPWTWCSVTAPPRRPRSDGSTGCMPACEGRPRERPQS